MNKPIERKWIPLEHVYPANGQMVIASDGENTDIVTWRDGVWELENAAAPACEFAYIKWTPLFVRPAGKIEVNEDDWRELLDSMQNIIESVMVMHNTLTGIIENNEA